MCSRSRLCLKPGTSRFSNFKRPEEARSGRNAMRAAESAASLRAAASLMTYSPLSVNAVHAVTKFPATTSLPPVRSSVQPQTGPLETAPYTTVCYDRLPPARLGTSRPGRCVSFQGETGSLHRSPHCYFYPFATQCSGSLQNQLLSSDDKVKPEPPGVAGDVDWLLEEMKVSYLVHVKICRLQSNSKASRQHTPSAGPCLGICLGCCRIMWTRE